MVKVFWVVCANKKKTENTQIGHPRLCKNVCGTPQVSHTKPNNPYKMHPGALGGKASGAGGG